MEGEGEKKPPQWAASESNGERHLSGGAGRALLPWETLVK
jgi:hypothetical protein